MRALALVAVCLALGLVAGACDQGTGPKPGTGSAGGSGVPQVSPEIATQADDCKMVVLRLRQAVSPQLSQTGSAGIEQLNKIMPVMEQACTEDGWPAEIRSCIIATQPGDMKALEACSAKMPKELQDKINKRMSQML